MNMTFTALKTATVLVGLLLFALPDAALGTGGLKGVLSNLPLKHKWTVECGETQCAYKSTYKPPAPFT